MKSYTIWVDYGSDGWEPQDPMAALAVKSFILNGNSYGHPVRVTEDASLVKIMADAEEEAEALRKTAL